MFCPFGKGLWDSWFSVRYAGRWPLVLDTLILSSIRCACPRYAVPVRDTLCLSLIHWAGLSLCLCLLGTEFWPWCRFITRQDSNLQLACGEAPSLLLRSGIKPLTGTAKANWTLVPTAFILVYVAQLSSQIESAMYSKNRFKATYSYMIWITIEDKRVL